MATTQNAAMTLTQKIISIAVIIIVISTIALPVIDSDFSREIQHTNTGYQYRVGSTSDDVTISIVSTGVVSINGVNYSDLTSYAAVAFTDTGWIRMAGNGNSLTVFGSQSLSNSQILTSSVTYSNGTITWESGGSTYTDSYTSPVYHISDSGNYAAFKNANTPTIYFNEDSSLWTMAANATATNSGLSPSSITARTVVFNGTYNDFDSTELLITTDGVEGVKATVNMSSFLVDHGSYYGWEDVDTVPFTIETDLGNYSSSTIWIIAPLNYTEIEGEGTNTLFSVVAILLVLVPVMMAVRMITLKRN